MVERVAGLVGGPVIIIPLCGPTCKMARLPAKLKFPSLTRVWQYFPAAPPEIVLLAVFREFSKPDKANLPNQAYSIDQTKANLP